LHADQGELKLQLFRLPIAGGSSMMARFLKGAAMTAIFLLCAMLFQAATPASKPIIDNERVTVWDASNSVPAQPTDSVVVSFSGNATFVPKGKTPKVEGRSMVIDLKDHAVPPIPNNSGYPLAFPRPGIKKLFENDRVIVWDYTWVPDVPTPMHFHDKDVVVLFLEDGDLKSTAPDGQSVVNPYTAGTIRFNAGNRTHSETLVKGKQRAIITELK
jgi:hypothetical protein